MTDRMDRATLAAIVHDQLAAVVTANKRRRAALDGTGPASTALVAADAIMLAADQYAAACCTAAAAVTLDAYAGEMRHQLRKLLGAEGPGPGGSP